MQVQLSLKRMKPLIGISLKSIPKKFQEFPFQCRSKNEISHQSQVARKLLRLQNKIHLRLSTQKVAVSSQPGILSDANVDLP